jgi:hypothetical protein
MSKKVPVNICTETSACWGMGESMSGWASWGDQILGLAVLPNRLTDTEYHRFLMNDFPVLLEHVSLHQGQHMWLCMMGHHLIFSALSHSTRTRLGWTVEAGSGGSVNWPARSPELKPLDFWLWGHLQTMMYSALINNLEILQQYIENACKESRVKPEIVDRVRTSVRQRAGSCVEMHGNHTENAL